MAILTDAEADLAWFFSPNHGRFHSEADSWKLNDREICLLETQDKKTREVADLLVTLAKSVIEQLEEKNRKLEQDNNLLSAQLAEMHQKWDRHYCPGSGPLDGPMINYFQG